MFLFSLFSRKGKGKATNQDGSKGKPSEKDESSAQGQSSTKGKTRPQLQSTDGASSNDQIDVLFLQDTTASQGPYINAAKTAIRDICQKISTTSNMAPHNIRFGLVAFRDHPPQDRTYVTKDFGFTSDIAVMEKNLHSLKPQGGGDGPEAQTAALALALNMKWKENAAKMVVLITDAPPHGIGEDNDGFDASPDQNDPLDLARQMAERGITLFVVACEPALSHYRNAVDFYRALTEITSGQMFPLTMADRLGDYITGTAVETIETEKLIQEYKKEVVNNVYEQSKPIEEVMEEVHNMMKQKGVKINTMAVENVYGSSSAAETNANIWKTSDKLSEARDQVTRIDEPRMKSEYSSGSRAPAVEFKEAEVEYSQAKRIVMQSVMRSSKVTSKGMTRR
ncbi:hypothetical protein GALMADRAFT_223440 [Galerina marginata CBS 339.88]|uniref:VWFA domain-containing protein n=1 Tax=Galerina marginata (strain CBS 339.88) TaxID=685588 RepID=A0A067T7L9_GALM3|nr:hypothetical protein GALMADRAFT_223440 [Galerina marginata CBS 339.88]